LPQKQGIDEHHKVALKQHVRLKNGIGTGASTPCGSSEDPRLQQARVAHTRQATTNTWEQRMSAISQPPRVANDGHIATMAISQPQAARLTRVRTRCLLNSEERFTCHHPVWSVTMHRQSHKRTTVRFPHCICCLRLPRANHGQSHSSWRVVPCNQVWLSLKPGTPKANCGTTGRIDKTSRCHATRWHATDPARMFGMKHGALMRRAGSVSGLPPSGFNGFASACVCQTR
jgi:hypothetical protein